MGKKPKFSLLFCKIILFIASAFLIVFVIIDINNGRAELLTSRAGGPLRLFIKPGIYSMQLDSQIFWLIEGQRIFMLSICVLFLWVFFLKSSKEKQEMKVKNGLKDNWK